MLREAGGTQNRRALGIGLPAKTSTRGEEASGRAYVANRGARPDDRAGSGAMGKETNRAHCEPRGSDQRCVTSKAPRRIGF